MKDRIPLVSSLDPEDLDTLGVLGGSTAKNIIFDAYVDDKVYATQRPAINVVEDASETTSDERGRGVFYWETTSSLYIINDDSLHKDSYSTTVGSIDNGENPVTFLELPNYMIILDPENNAGWYVNSSDVLTQITDPDFPSTIVGGGAVLNSVIYVMDENGSIYASGINDPTSWSALDVITAEREPDAGIYLGKIADYLVAFGSKTIEFFYDAANATGSPLSRREDISYRGYGAIDPYSFYSSGDVIYFLASDATGSLSILKLANFEVSKVSSSTIDGYLNKVIVTDDNKFVMAGAIVRGHTLLFLTEIDQAESNLTPTLTLSYDDTTRTWGVFSTEILDHTTFPVVQWSDRIQGSVRFGAGVLYNGDIIRFSTNNTPVDTSGATESNIKMLIRLPEYGGSGEVLYNNKFLSKVELVGGSVQGVDENDVVNIRWSDDHYNTYSATRVLSLKPGRKLGSLGRFNRRAFEVSYSGSKKLKLEALELMYGVSSYA